MTPFLWFRKTKKRLRSERQDGAAAGKAEGFCSELSVFTVLLSVLSVTKCLLQLESHPLASLGGRKNKTADKDAKKKKGQEGEQQQQQRFGFSFNKKDSTVQKAVTAVRQHPASSTAVGALAFYTALRAGIEVGVHTPCILQRCSPARLCPACVAQAVHGMSYGSLWGCLLLCLYAVGCTHGNRGAARLRFACPNVLLCRCSTTRGAGFCGSCWWTSALRWRQPG